MSLQVISSETETEGHMVTVYLTMMFCDKFLSCNLYRVKSNGPSTAEICAYMSVSSLKKEDIASLLNNQNYLDISVFLHRSF